MAVAARAATAPVIRPFKAELLDLTLARVATVSIVVTDDYIPEVVMFEGDPFLRDPTISPSAYRQVRTVHAIRS